MKYYLLDMSRLTDNNYEIVESAFQTWWDTYSKEYLQRGQKLNPDTFWNTKILAVMTWHNRVIGTHIYNPFHLCIPSAISHSYFNDLTPEKIQELKSQKIQSLMSMEYLLVHPDFRGKQFDFKWAEVVIGLGLKFMTESPWDAAIGIARDDKKVTQMSARMGATSQGQLEKMKTPCQIMLLHKNGYQPHPNQNTAQIIHKLWENKSSNIEWLTQKDQLMKVG